jgi:small-conductance mechanosensitive channel
MIELKAGAAAGEAGQNLSQKTVRLAGEASTWLTNNIVDIVIAVAIGSVIALVLFGIRAFGSKLLRHDAETAWRRMFARMLAKTKIVFIILASAILVAEHAQTPPDLLRVIEILFVIAAAIQCAIWARELILGFVEHRAGVDEEHSRLGSAVGIIRLLVSVALFAIAIIVILDNLGVNVTGLVAGLGIGGIAIGLAAQGIFKDLFAALAIIFDKPFRKGDGIRVDQLNGTVEQIGLKTTRIRSLDGEEVILSNAILLDKEIHNFAYLEHRRFVLRLGLVYQTPPEVCARVPDIVRDIVAAHPPAAFIRCGLVGFGASSLDFEVQFDIQSADYELAFATRAAICLDILRRFAEQDIAFAYPTTTTFTAAPDGTLVMPYHT